VTARVLSSLAVVTRGIFSISKCTGRDGLGSAGIYDPGISMQSAVAVSAVTKL